VRNIVGIIIVGIVVCSSWPVKLARIKVLCLWGNEYFVRREALVAENVHKGVDELNYCASKTNIWLVDSTHTGIIIATLTAWRELTLSNCL
jgi:hypothetical protein